MRISEFQTEGAFHNPGHEDSPVAQAITRRILMQRTDLLAKYGPEKVGQAVDEVADWVGDVDEIGSSDVSGWVKQVERQLNDYHGVAEDKATKDKHYYLRNNIWRVMDGDELVHEYIPARYEIPGAKKLLAQFDDEGYDVTHVISPSGKVTYLYGKPEEDMDEGVSEAGYGRATGRASWDSNMPGYQGDYGGAENWGRRHREDDEFHDMDRRNEEIAARGTWYITINGKLLKNKEGQPFTFVGKAAANKAALTMMQKPFNQGKKFMLTTKGE